MPVWKPNLSAYALSAPPPVVPSAPTPEVDYDDMPGLDPVSDSDSDDVPELISDTEIGFKRSNSNINKISLIGIDANFRLRRREVVPEVPARLPGDLQCGERWPAYDYPSDGEGVESIWKLPAAWQMSYDISCQCTCSCYAKLHCGEGNEICSRKQRIQYTRE
ncbi:hypothetical protein DFH06DRAFT_1151225 [Mycena polygramma]|nr:hypothetical protein DFH06DRAFT_1151225 [Mycena polygramma]